MKKHIKTVAILLFTLTKHVKNIFSIKKTMHILYYMNSNQNNKLQFETINISNNRYKDYKKTKLRRIINYEIINYYINTNLYNLTPFKTTDNKNFLAKFYKQINISSIKKDKKINDILDIKMGLQQFFNLPKIKERNINYSKNFFNYKLNIGLILLDKIKNIVYANKLDKIIYNYNTNKKKIISFIYPVFAVFKIVENNNILKNKINPNIYYKLQLKTKITSKIPRVSLFRYLKGICITSIKAFYKLPIKCIKLISAIASTISNISSIIKTNIDKIYTSNTHHIQLRPIAKIIAYILNTTHTKDIMYLEDFVSSTDNIYIQLLSKKLLIYNDLYFELQNDILEPYSKIHYVTYEFPLLSKTFRLFTIQIIGFLYKYYLNIYKNTELLNISKDANTQILNINNKFNLIINKKNYNKSYNFYHLLHLGQCNLNTTVLENNNFYLPINTIITNKNNKLFREKLLKNIKLEKNKKILKNTMNNIKDGISSSKLFESLNKTNFISKKIYTNIISNKYEKTLPKKRSKLNFTNKYFNYNINIKLFIERKQLINKTLTTIQYLNPNLSIFYYNNTVNNNYYNIIIKIILQTICSNLMFFLPIIIKITIQNSNVIFNIKKIENIILLYIFLLKNFKYNLDKIIQTNLHLFYSHIFLYFTKEIHKLLDTNHYSNNYKKNITNCLYKLIKQYNTINEMFYADTVTNYNQVITSYLKLNKKYYSKINKLKLKKKTDYHLKIECIKYINYKKTANTLYISSKYYNTNLDRIAAQSFYNISIEINNKYHIKSKLYILKFKKFLMFNSKKYDINRWYTLETLILDLISNYKTIHKDSSILDLNATKIPTYKEKVLTKYFSEATNPYPKNILKTTVSNNFIQKLFFKLIKIIPFKLEENEYNFLEIDRLNYAYLESIQLFGFTKHKMMEPFESRMLRERTLPFSMKQRNIDVYTHNHNLWDIPVNKFKLHTELKYLYEPSYFNNGIYYLDFIDYIFFKYFILNKHITNNSFVKIKKKLQNTKKKFGLNNQVHKMELFVKIMKKLQKIVENNLRQTKKGYVETEEEKLEKIRKYESSWITRFNKKVKRNFLNKRFWEIVKGKIKLDKAREKEKEKRKKKKKKKIIPILPYKFAWDINMYDNKYLADTLNKYYNWNPNKFKRTTSKIKIFLYNINSLANYEIDPVPFQIAALRLFTSLDSTKINKSKIRKINKLLKLFAGKKIRLLKKSNKKVRQFVKVFSLFKPKLHKIKSKFYLFKHQRPTKLKKRLNFNVKWNNINTFLIQKIKTINRFGLSDLRILPQFVKNALEKEVYLYRKIISSKLQTSNDYPIKKVEHYRYVRTIINFDQIAQTINILNNIEVKNDLLKLKLFKNNIVHYAQIIVPYHAFYKDISIKLLHSALDSEYEWNAKQQKYKKRDPYLENKLITFLKDEDKYLKSQNKYLFFRHNIKKNKLFYNILDPTDELPYIECKGDYLINLINESNKQLVEYMYVNHKKYHNERWMDIDMIFKIYKLIFKLKSKIEQDIVKYQETAKNINSKLTSIKIIDKTYSNIRYNIINNLNILMDSNVTLKIPLAIIITFIAQFSDIEKYSQYASKNLLFDVHINTHFKKLNEYLNKYLYMNEKDINSTILQLSSFIHKKIPSSKPKQQNIEIIKQKVDIQSKQDKFIDGTIERRFIWYLLKSTSIQLDKSYVPINTYNDIFNILNAKNKFTNNKLQLYNIGGITNEFITTNKFLLNLVETPYYFHSMYKNKRHIYTQLEPVMVPINIEEEAGLLKLSYYKAVPFVLNKSKNTCQLFLYYDRRQLTLWENSGQYITYPIILSNNNNNKTFFIRYKIYDIDVLKKNNNYIPQEYYEHINYSYLTKKLGKITNSLYQNFYTYKFPHTYKPEELKAIYYSLNTQIKLGVLHYSIDLSKEHDKLAQVTKVSGLPNKELPMFRYIYNNIIDEAGNFFSTDEKSGYSETNPFLRTNIEKGFNYFILPYYPDTENIMLFRFLRKLTIKENKYIDNNYKITLKANKIPLLLYSISYEPLAMLLVYYSIGFLDTDSLSILKYNILKFPLANAGSIASLISFPSYIRNEDDTDMDVEYVDTAGVFYLRSKYNEMDPSIFAWPRHIDMEDYNLAGNTLILETEPLHLLGMELNINPFFRLFTYSGWKIWKEMINLLLVFQDFKFWNIGYSTDIHIFNKIFISRNFLNKPAVNIIELREQFKLYNIHMDIAQPYINKYHQMSNYNSFKEWLGYYYYGLLEYQRIMPDSYHQLFSQPSIRSFMNYYFINSKELELISKRSLNNLLGSIYSMQDSPIGYEEFFVYPNKRVHSYRMYTPAIIKNATALENYSTLTSNYKLPRTGYESYIYSYASNIWYSHHNLVTSDSLWHELFARFGYLDLEGTEEDDEIFFREIKKILDNMFGTIKRNIKSILFETHRHRPKTFRGIRPRPPIDEIKRSKLEIDPNNYIQNSSTIDPKRWAYIYGKEYGLFDILKGFFITNTIKYNDINLLYKINNIYKPPLNNCPNITLHPSIRNKYSIQFNNNNNLNINYSHALIPKLVTNKMVLLSIIYPNNTHFDKFNFFAKINPLSKLTNAHLNLRNIVNAHKWRFNSLITANANYHEAAFGPLWSIYQKNSAPTNKAINNSFLGSIIPTIRLGLETFNHDMFVDYLEETSRTADMNDKMYVRSPTTLPTSIISYPETVYFGTTDLDDVISMYQYPHADLSSSLYHEKNILKNLNFMKRRSYKNVMQKVLHSMYFPTNTISSREYTSYIPVGYSLITKDLLNNNYARSHYWYNPIYYRLNVINNDTSQIATPALKLLTNPNIRIEMNKVPNKVADLNSSIYVDDELYLDILTNKNSLETTLDEALYDDGFTASPIPIEKDEFMPIKKDGFIPIKKNEFNLKSHETQKKNIFELEDSGRITIWYQKYKAFKLWSPKKPKINSSRNSTTHITKKIYNPYTDTVLSPFNPSSIKEVYGKMYSNLINKFYGINKYISKANNITKNMISQHFIMPMRNNAYKYIATPIKHKIIGANNYVTNSINRATNSIDERVLALIDTTNEQIIKYDRHSNKYIYESALAENNSTTTKIDLTFDLGLIKKISREKAIFNNTSIKTNRSYGFKKYPDLYGPMFQSYSPSKQPHELNKILNHAITYTNRYHFINIYESFRLKPFYYLKIKNILSNHNTIFQYHISKAINKAINTTKIYLNNLLYPLENQFSTDRSTSRLAMWEPNMLYSFYQERKSEYPERIEKMYEKIYWTHKYLRLPGGIVIFPATPSTEEVVIGIKPTKQLIYKIMDIFKFNYYNKIIQSTYYKPTKSYYPMVTMSRIADYMNLSRSSNKNDQYDGTIYRYLAENPDWKQALDMTDPLRAEKKKRAEYRVEMHERVIRRYSRLTRFLKRLHRKDRIKQLFNVEKRGFRKYQFQPLPNRKKRPKKKREILKEHIRLAADILNPDGEPPATNKKETEVDIMKRIKLKNPKLKKKMRLRKLQLEIEDYLDRLKPRKYINLTAFKDFANRYNIPEMDEDLFTNGMYPSIIHKNNKVYQDLNMAGRLMQILIINNSQILDSHEDKKEFGIKYTKALKKILNKTLREYNLTNNLNNKLAYKTINKGEEGPLDVAIIADEVMDEADNILDAVGRTTYDDKLGGFTSRVMRLIETSSLLLFNNISNHNPQFFIHEISELVIPRVKPMKFSTNKLNIRNSVFELLYDKTNNRSLNNNYNQIVEPLALTYHRLLQEASRETEVDHNDEDTFISDANFEHEDEVVNDKAITGKGLRSDEHKVFHTAYWRYLSTKQQSNKYQTDEFITFKSNPHVMIDTSSEFANETQNFITVRGSFKSKQFIYNYKINQKRHSLPLVDYFYYSQFGIDKSQLLKLNQFYILNKNLFSIFNNDYIAIHPYISKEKKQLDTNTININKNKVNKIINESIDLNNIIEFINYSIYTAMKPKTIETIYLYNNTLIRPIAHWFVQIYYNNIYYFDAFYSWCCDLVSNLIIF